MVFHGAWPEEVKIAAAEPVNDLGKFVLVRLLGRGGMGEVYKAWEKELGRYVALKILRTSDDEDRRRFLREAQTAARLDHPGIVPVYEIGQGPRGPYLAMKYIEGVTVDRAGLSLREKVTALRDVATAMHYAHSQGVIHRDIKPSNILIETHPFHAYITDFGLARQASVDSSLSVSGTIIGTPQYMPPEQALGWIREVDPRSDVYALGSTLYHLLAGVPPFSGESAVEILGKVVNRDPLPLRRYNPAVPRDLETIVMKCLDKEKRRRYPTARDLAEDLDRWLSGEPIMARPLDPITRTVRRIRKHPTVFALAAVIVLGALAALGGAIRGQVARRQELARLLARAGEHMSRREWEAAAEHFQRAQALAPNDASIVRQRRLSEEMGRATRALQWREDARRRLAQITVPEVKSYDPASRRELRWQAEDAIAQARRQLEEAEVELERAALSAQELPEARQLLSNLYLERFEAGGDGRERWKALALKYGAVVEDSAWLNVTTVPDGAAAYLFRYEERKRRLIPLPCNAAGEVRETECPSVDAVDWTAPEEEKRRVREGTAYPLHKTGYNRVRFPLRIRAGSYLVVLEKEGYVDARLPVLLAARERVEEKVMLLRASDLPEGFIYVLEGRFIAGSDPEAVDATGRPRVEAAVFVPAFMIAKFSTTVGEYLEFLNDRDYHSAREAVAHIPRASALKPYGRLQEDTFLLYNFKMEEPVIGISVADAEAYARWYTRRHGRGKWVFRLPTEDEWEKAARGTDGRFFPWGNRFDPSFAAMAESRSVPTVPRDSVLEQVGLFPADESPYGVRDMAGVVRCLTSTEIREGIFVVKGGAWGHGAGGCRSAGRGIVHRWAVNDNHGFRLVAELARGH